MASTIAIHVGGTDIRLGQQLWDVLLAEHGVSHTGAATTESLGSGADFFAPAVGGRFVPRAIVTDSDTDAIGSLRKRWTTMSTPGCRLLLLRNPCSRLLCCRSVCITRFANRRHTLPSSRRS